MTWNIKSLFLLCCLTSKLVIDTHYKTQASTQEENNNKKKIQGGLKENRLLKRSE